MFIFRLSTFACHSESIMWKMIILVCVLKKDSFLLETWAENSNYLPLNHNSNSFHFIHRLYLTLHIPFQILKLLRVDRFSAMSCRPWLFGFLGALLPLDQRLLLIIWMTPPCDMFSFLIFCTTSFFSHAVIFIFAATVVHIEPYSHEWKGSASVHYKLQSRGCW